MAADTAPWGEAGTGYAALPSSMKQSAERFELSLGELAESDEPEEEEQEVYSPVMRTHVASPPPRVVRERSVPEHLRRLQRPDILPTIHSIASLGSFIASTSNELLGHTRTFSDQLTIPSRRRRSGSLPKGHAATAAAAHTHSASSKIGLSEGLDDVLGVSGAVDEHEREQQHAHSYRSKSLPLGSLKPQMRKLIAKVVPWTSHHNSQHGGDAHGDGRCVSETSLGRKRDSSDAANLCRSKSQPSANVAARASVPLGAKSPHLMARFDDKPAPASQRTKDDLDIQQILSIPWED